MPAKINEEWFKQEDAKGNFKRFNNAEDMIAYLEERRARKKRAESNTIEEAKA